MEPFTLVAVVSLLAPLFTLVKEAFDTHRQRRDLSRQVEVVQQLERELDAHQKESFVDFFEKQLRATIERERLAMLRAEGSYTRLATLGTSLMVLSVFAPVASAVLYATIPPISQETMALLEQLRTKAGFTPGPDSITVSRDWHILLAGLSLGFLFVAAARGILRQEAQQREVFFRVVRRVSYFENLVTVLRVKQRLATEPVSQLTESCQVILEDLVRPPQSDIPAEKPSSDTEAQMSFREYIEKAFTAATEK